MIKGSLGESKALLSNDKNEMCRHLSELREVCPDFLQRCSGGESSNKDFLCPSHHLKQKQD